MTTRRRGHGGNKCQPVIRQTAPSGGFVRSPGAFPTVSGHEIRPACLTIGVTFRMKRRLVSSRAGSTPALADASWKPSATRRRVFRRPHIRKRPDVHGLALQRIGPVVVTPSPGRSLAVPSASPRTRHAAPPESPFAKARAPPGTDGTETCERTAPGRAVARQPRH